MQPSTADFVVPIEVEVAVLLQVGKTGPTCIGTLTMPSDSPTSDLAGLLRAAADELDRADGTRGGR